MKALSDMRQHYGASSLRRKDLAADPFAQFAQWFQTARECAAITEANAMTLATSDQSGSVSARTVLLKDWDERGFVFFTNYESAKARQIEANPSVCLLFPWVALERQIVIQGIARKTTPEESATYFASRPLKSRIAASVSPQSQPVASREILERDFETIQAKFAGGDVPLPAFWGGYRVEPTTMEFWQGRADRLHDRFLFTKDEGGGWQATRLAP